MTPLYKPHNPNIN